MLHQRFHTLWFKPNTASSNTLSELASNAIHIQRACGHFATLQFLGIAPGRSHGQRPHQVFSQAQSHARAHSHDYYPRTCLIAVANPSLGFSGLTNRPTGITSPSPSVLLKSTETFMFKTWIITCLHLRAHSHGHTEKRDVLAGTQPRSKALSRGLSFILSFLRNICVFIWALASAHAISSGHQHINVLQTGSVLLHVGSQVHTQSVVFNALLLPIILSNQSSSKHRSSNKTHSRVDTTLTGSGGPLARLPRTISHHSLVTHPSTPIQSSSSKSLTC